RRLDENTGPENFLCHAFKISVGGPDWQRLEEGFLKSFDVIETLADAPRRTHNRLRPPPPAAPLPLGWQHFVNEPDTDFSLPHNSEWAKQIIERWKPRHGEKAVEIPLVIDGEEIFPENLRKAKRKSCSAGVPPANSSGVSPGEVTRGET